MTTINDIQFDHQFYSQFQSLVVLLYQSERVGLAIHLSNPNLFKFIHPFNAIHDCQQHIDQNKIFTLFTYSDNIETWIWNNNPIKDNLENIYIFCPFKEDKQYFKDYTRRFRSKIRDVITSNQLERELLIFGLKYLNDLEEQFQDNQNIVNVLRGYQRNICLALSNAFHQAANSS